MGFGKMEGKFWVGEVEEVSDILLESVCRWFW